MTTLNKFRDSIQYSPTLEDGSTITIDTSIASSYKVTLGGNRTIEFTGGHSPGRTFKLTVKQDVSGSRMVTWPDGGTLVWSGGSPPTLTTGSFHQDIFEFSDDGKTYTGYTQAVAATTVIELNT